MAYLIQRGRFCRFIGFLSFALERREAGEETRFPFRVVDLGVVKVARKGGGFSSSDLSFFFFIPMVLC